MRKLAIVVLLAACGGTKHASDMSGVVADMSSTDSGADGMVSVDGGDASMPTCITPTTTQACAAPINTALPICKLSLTGCMDSTNITSVNSAAVYYEVNSPLWSDNAAKTRAFVLPQGGQIHVKDCSNTTNPPAECIAPNNIPNGSQDTGKWVFPVGTVMIKSFEFDGKLVETRLLMHVDAATATLIGNGTDWVGYNYEWNEAQTEATIVPNGARDTVMFNTGKQTVTWPYPSFADCINCHAAATGTLGLDTPQMNRTVNSANQIDTFVKAGLFDSTAPQAPYMTAMVEPYANSTLGLTGPPMTATTDQEARSYLAANCGFCHRPDVNNQGFDLRFANTLFQSKICGLTAQDTIPGMSGMTYEDFKPGDHANSAIWIRMNISSTPNSTETTGRMPPAGSFTVDPQGTSLIGSWIDATKSCPTM